MSPFVALPPAIAALPAHVKPAGVVRRAHSAPYGWQILTVRSGDTLSDIAIAHRCTVGALIARNRIRDGGDFLAIGRHLSVPRITPAHVPATVAAARTATHIVRSGETLGGIASHYRVSLSMLYSLNRISRTAYIQPGQRIRIPAQAARSSPILRSFVRIRPRIHYRNTSFTVPISTTMATIPTSGRERACTRRQIGCETS